MATEFGMVDESKIQLNIFNFKDLVALTILSAVEADFCAAKTTLKSIEEFGIKNGHLKMLSFTYTYVDGGVFKVMEVKIPLLSLISFPLLQISEAKFRFGMRILEQVKETNDNSGSFRSTNLIGLLADQKIQPEKRSKGKRYYQSNMSVEVNVVKSDLPAGLMKLINLSQEACVGSPKQTLVINPTKDTLYFASDKNCDFGADLVNSSTDREIVDRVVSFKIVQTSEDVSNLFDKSPTLLKGDVVGRPTVSDISVLSHKGSVRLRYFPNFQRLDQSANGWIEISCRGADPINVFFKIGI